MRDFAAPNAQESDTPGVGRMRVDEPTGCSESPDGIPVRQAGFARSAGHTVASGPALSDADPKLFAERHSRRPHPELAAGRHSNHVARAFFQNKTTEFAVEVDLVADLSSFNPFDFFLEPGVEEYPFDYAPDLAKDLEPYRAVSRLALGCRLFSARFPRDKRGTIGFLVDLNRSVRDEIGYVTRLDPGVQTMRADS